MSERKFSCTRCHNVIVRVGLIVFLIKTRRRRFLRRISRVAVSYTWPFIHELLLLRPRDSNGARHHHLLSLQLISIIVVSVHVASYIRDRCAWFSTLNLFCAFSRPSRFLTTNTSNGLYLTSGNRMPAQKVTVSHDFLDRREITSCVCEMTKPGESLRVSCESMRRGEGEIRVRRAVESGSKARCDASQVHLHQTIASGENPISDAGEETATIEPTRRKLVPSRVFSIETYTHRRN